MPDKILGIETPFATWKMVERVSHKVSENPAFDDPIRAGVVATLCVHVILRSTINNNVVIGLVLNILRSVAADILHELIKGLWVDFADEIIKTGIGLNILYKEDLNGPVQIRA